MTKQGTAASSSARECYVFKKPYDTSKALFSFPLPCMKSSAILSSALEVCEKLSKRSLAEGTQLSFRCCETHSHMSAYITYEPGEQVLQSRVQEAILEILGMVQTFKQLAAA
jgi:hypothetical protein